MGHLETKSIKLLEENNFIEVSRWMKSTIVCISFQLRKNYKLPFSLRNKTSSKPLDKIHCDLWWGGGGGGGGWAAPSNSTQGYRYYVIFVDDHTRYTWLYPLKRKSYFFEYFLKFQILVKNQFERQINFFRVLEEVSSNQLVFIII